MILLFLEELMELDEDMNVFLEIERLLLWK